MHVEVRNCSGNVDLFDDVVGAVQDGTMALGVVAVNVQDGGQIVGAVLNKGTKVASVLVAYEAGAAPDEFLAHTVSMLAGVHG